jgi:SAM-dependent methyltransferase
MLKKAFDRTIGVSPRAKRFMIRGLYGLLVRLDRNRELVFMNYGFANPDPAADPELRPEDEPNRYCIQLYHHVASAVDLRGKEVLEVGSGRGGGASYVTRYLHPARYRGVDISERAVATCNSVHAGVPGLSFHHGDAENIPLPDASVDAVINVESSHGYGSLPRFLGEVVRVLRPGGHFLYTDHRSRSEVAEWRAQLAASGLEQVSETDISNNVVAALDREDERKRALLDRRVPRPLRDAFGEFAAVRGSKAHQRFTSGDTRYLSFVFRKP